MEKYPYWETNWFELRENTLLKLKNNLLQELILKGIKKAGNLNQLIKQLNLSYPSFLYALRKDTYMVSVRKLKKLAEFLKIDYSYFNKKILETKKCKIISIKNPKFPFNLKTKEGAYLLGYIVSDGTIYTDRKSRNVTRTKYSSNDKESTTKFIRSIKKVFGNVHMQKEITRGNTYIKMGSSIIGDSLIKAGAHLGNKTKNNLPLPKLIKENKFLQKYYLQSIFDDEGSLAGSKDYAPYIILTRANRLKINKNTKIKLNKVLKPLMKERKFPTGHTYSSISFKKFKEIFPELSIKFSKEGISNLLLGEEKILNNLGIETRIWIRSLSKTQLGHYSLAADLFISRKQSILKFYKEVNFSLNRKKDKLQNCLMEAQWI
jgi:hypothetical protein